MKWGLMTSKPSALMPIKSVLLAQGRVFVFFNGEKDCWGSVWADPVCTTSVLPFSHSSLGSALLTQ